MTPPATPPATIPHALADVAARHGDDLAVIANDQNWSYRELWHQCRRVAGGMRASGVGAGDRVAIWAPNSREWIVVAIAAMIVGAAIVPLNTRLKGREAGDMLRRTHARVLFTVADFLAIDYVALIADEDLPALRATVLIDRDLDVFAARGTQPDDATMTALLAQIDGDTVSDIIFTSGTTGVPKGVVMTHDRVVAPMRHWIANTGLRAGDRYLIVNPFFHSFGYKAGWVACILARATMVPVAQFDVEQVVAAIERDRITFMPGPPTIFQALLARNDDRAFDTTSLRGGTTGAATVAPSLVARIRAELGVTDIVTAYGMTECTTITSCRIGDADDVIAQTCGVALAGNDVAIVDDAGAAVARGSTGEIVVRGPGVMRGYLDDPAATAAAIDADGWLRTGDVGTMDAAGYVRITDRKKDLYISGGFNCYPAEVERMLAAHPAIAMVAVTGVAHDRLGEVGKAWIVRRAGTTADAGEIIAWARANMANYKVPHYVEFRNDLPRNAAGKVAKLDLA